MTLIHSHRIHNHSPIRITIVIYNSIHVASTKSWPNHPFTMVSWGTNGSSCADQHMYSSMNSLCRRCIVTTSKSGKLFIFTPLAWTPNTASTNISWIRCCVINKTLNPITIIHHQQSLRWILIHPWIIIHDFY